MRTIAFAISIATLLSLASVAQQASADVLLVPADYPSILEASLVAVSGDTILVAPGFYDLGHATVSLRDGVTLKSDPGREVTS